MPARRGTSVSIVTRFSQVRHCRTKHILRAGFQPLSYAVLPAKGHEGGLQHSDQQSAGNIVAVTVPCPGAQRASLVRTRTRICCTDRVSVSFGIDDVVPLHSPHWADPSRRSRPPHRRFFAGLTASKAVGCFFCCCVLAFSVTDSLAWLILAVLLVITIPVLLGFLVHRMGVHYDHFLELSTIAEAECRWEEPIQIRTPPDS